MRATFKNGHTYYTLDPYLVHRFGETIVTHYVVETIRFGKCIERQEFRPLYSVGKWTLKALKEARKACKGIKLIHVRSYAKKNALSNHSTR